MSAVVIGATGAVGRQLVRQLQETEACRKILIFVRSFDSEFSAFSKVEQKEIKDFFSIKSQDVLGYSHAFSTLGTTKRKAVSKENFYRIDFEMNAHFADLFEATKTHYLLVSAVGAQADSVFFYSRVKGQLEQKIKGIGFDKISLIQPSLLLANRSEKRFIEDLTQSIFSLSSQFLPKIFKYKPVTVEQVAHTMVVAALDQTEQLKIYDNLAIQNINSEGN